MTAGGCLIVFLLTIAAATTTTAALGAGDAVCPESKKLHSGDCRLFYKCVPLATPAQAYVWVPSRCTAGLVFHPGLRQCVLPESSWGCPKEPPIGASMYVAADVVSNTAPPPVQGTSSSSSSSSSSPSSEYDDYDTPPELPSSTPYPETNSVPLSAVNNPARIGTQMSRLTQLINSLKAGATAQRVALPVQYFIRPTAAPARRPALDDSHLPAQIRQITAQLISPGHPQSVVSDLYRKYLANNTFLRQGEFTKPHGPDLEQQKQRVPGRCRPGERLAHPADCTKYYICRGRSSSGDLPMLVFSCPPNTAFNDAKKFCDVDGHKGCFQAAGAPSTERACRIGTRVADPTSKNHYIVCLPADDGGDWRDHKLKCPTNFEYCSKREICLPNSYCF